MYNILLYSYTYKIGSFSPSPKKWIDLDPRPGEVFIQNAWNGQQNTDVCLHMSIRAYVLHYIYSIYIYFYLYHHFIHHIYRWVFSCFSKKRYPKTQEQSTRITRLILDKVPLADAGLEGSWEFCQIPWDDNLYISSDMGPLKLFGNMFLLYIHNYS